MGEYTKTDIVCAIKELQRIKEDRDRKYPALIRKGDMSYQVAERRNKGLLAAINILSDLSADKSKDAIQQNLF